MKETQQTEMFCIRCADDTIHTITTIHQTLHKIECMECGKEVVANRDIHNQFYHDYLDRVLTKRGRIQKEFQQNKSKFVLSFPFRVMSKPLRMFREAKGWVKWKKSK